MLLQDCTRVQFLLVAIGSIGFSIFTNPIFGCSAIFGNFKFIQILITKYVTGSLKAMGNLYLIIPLFFNHMLLINNNCGFKII